MIGVMIDMEKKDRNSGDQEGNVVMELNTSSTYSFITLG